jgi:hypothetical protein
MALPVAPTSGYDRPFRTAESRSMSSSTGDRRRRKAPRLLITRTDGTFFSITAFSRPAEPLARLAGPISRAIQLAINRGFVSALARYVQSGA